jgi:hypothetical protein
MMVAGGLSFAAGETDGPWYAIYAVLFGIGLGLTIDEYALALHLDDVYWSRQGRSSIDATLIAPARQAAIGLGEALLRRAPPGQAGVCRASIPGRPSDRPDQGTRARRDRWGHGRGVPGAARRRRADDDGGHAEAIAVTEIIRRLGRTPGAPVAPPTRRRATRDRADAGAGSRPHAAELRRRPRGIGSVAFERL